MWKYLSTFLLYCCTATLMYIATVAIIIDVSTLSILPKLNGACHPVGRDHHSGALSCGGIASAILGSGRPGISPSGARSASGLNFNAGLPRGLRSGDTPCCCCCCCYCFYYYIITKDVVPRDHCLVFILIIDVMTLLFFVPVSSE